MSRTGSFDRVAVLTTGDTDALVERIFGAVIDTLEVASVHLGGRLGFYRALADRGNATPGDLAARTGTAERYVREWLEQQAVAGFLTVDHPDGHADTRRYVARQVLGGTYAIARLSFWRGFGEHRSVVLESRRRSTTWPVRARGSWCRHSGRRAPRVLLSAC